jgi:hypothetical protein
MMGSADPHRFRKTVAGACMLVAPALGLLGFIVSPGLDSDASVQLATVAAHRDQWFISETLVLTSLVVLVPAILGLMHMLREREAGLGHLGGGLAMVGTLAAVGSTAIAFVVWQMASADADLLNRVDDTTGTFVLFFLAVFALPAGLVLLALGLVRAHAVHRNLAACVAVGAVVAAVGFAAAAMWLLVAGYALLMVGLGLIGHMVLGETVEEWEHTPTLAAGAH